MAKAKADVRTLKIGRLWIQLWPSWGRRRPYRFPLWWRRLRLPIPRRGIWTPWLRVGRFYGDPSLDAGRLMVRIMINREARDD